MAVAQAKRVAPSCVEIEVADRSGGEEHGVPEQGVEDALGIGDAAVMPDPTARPLASSTPNIDWERDPPFRETGGVVSLNTS